MPTKAIKDLHALVKKLGAERDAHEAAIADIDAAFADLGVMTPGKKKRRGRPPGRPKKAVGKKRRAKKAKRGRPKGKKKATTKVKKATKKATKPGRRRFKVPGHEWITSFVKKAGAKGVTGAQIVKQWTAQGRGSGVYVEISRLVKAKKLKRENLKGKRGSLYRAA